MMGLDSMAVRAAAVRLRILEAMTLKDRRSVVKSLLDRLGRLGVSACDLDGGTAVNGAVIGLAAVSRDASHAVEVLHSAVALIEREDRAEIIDVEYS